MPKRRPQDPPRRRSAATGQFTRLENKDLIERDFSALSPDELRKEMKRLNKLVNTRVSRLEKQALPPPSLIKFKYETGGKPLTVRGKSDAQLLQQFAQIKEFLRGGTSTVSQAKSFWTKYQQVTGKTDKELEQMVQEMEADPAALQDFGEYRDALGSAKRKEIYDEGKSLGLHGDAWTAYSIGRAKQEYFKIMKEEANKYAQESNQAWRKAGEASAGSQFGIGFDPADFD